MGEVLQHDNRRLQGTVWQVNAERGFGFIRENEGGVHYFFHANECKDGPIEDLVSGMGVSFLPAQTVKGPRALDVRREEGGR